jgi:(+)-trans-carveol dehydrogenase
MIEGVSMGRVDAKVAFITGAARGQGRSHAVRLAEEGADIIAIDLCESLPGVPYDGPTEADLAETARMVEKLGRRVFTRKVDVRDYEALAAALDAGVAELGRLDIVSANAGITVDPLPTELIEEDVWGRISDINLHGVWHTCKAAIPHLKKNEDGGSIVLTSSAAGIQGYPYTADYTAAKHGVNGLMKSLAQELGPHWIRVNTLCPSQVNTPMIMHDAYYRLFCPDKENPGPEDFAVTSQRMHSLPIPWVEPRDVSNALLFLVSDEGRYITGVALPVDAGCTTKSTA